MGTIRNELSVEFPKAFLEFSRFQMFLRCSYKALCPVASAQRRRGCRTISTKRTSEAAQSAQSGLQELFAGVIQGNNTLYRKYSWKQIEKFKNIDYKDLGLPEVYGGAGRFKEVREACRNNVHQKM